MALKIEDIREYISKISFVKQIYRIEQGEIFINGKVEISFAELNESLDFEFEIAPQYPLKSFESESITFRNKDLVSYHHVMSAGSICIHTSHSTDLEEKINIDFNSLKDWIVKYYINKGEDSNYEHIIVGEDSINDQYYAYCFTDCEEEFEIGECGSVHLSHLNSGIYKERTILNFIIQGFTSVDKANKKCQWGNIYGQLKTVETGLYYFLKDAPVFHRKFAFRRWIEFKDLLPINFLKFLSEFEKYNLRKLKGSIVPIFLGYRINETELHWQVALLEIGKFVLAP